MTQHSPNVPQSFEGKRFLLLRHEDISGVSGTGVVASGIQFPNGKCAMSWHSRYTSIAIYDTIEDLIAVHSHGDKSEVKFID